MCKSGNKAHFFTIFYLCIYLYFENKSQRWWLKLISITIMTSLSIFYLLSHSHSISCSCSYSHSFSFAPSLPFSLLPLLHSLFYFFLKCKKKWGKAGGRSRREKKIVVKFYFHSKLKIFISWFGSQWKIPQTPKFYVKLKSYFQSFIEKTSVIIIAMQYLSWQFNTF